MSIQRPASIARSCRSASFQFLALAGDNCSLSLAPEESVQGTYTPDSASKYWIERLNCCDRPVAGMLYALQHNSPIILRRCSRMSDGPEEKQQAGREAIPPCDEGAREPDRTNRRELIERYAKYAVVAAPLLLFVSKANAIHSKP